MSEHKYSNGFFDYIDDGARSSARQLISVLKQEFEPTSVLDLGCGRGVWLDEWRDKGVKEIVGVDGDYVDRQHLAIEPECFLAKDLTKPIDLGRKFDLAQSLEVGEHLPEDASRTLVATLTQHSARVLFSAAVPGQGGEFHINEKPLEFWRQLFAAFGYHPYDCLRPSLSHRSDVEPWYKYNSILYLTDDAANSMSEAVRATRIPDDVRLPHLGSFGWQLRKATVSLLPRQVVTKIASTRAAYLNRIKAKT